MWAYPAVDVVVMDHLTDTLGDGAWVGSWWPDDRDHKPVVIVQRAGSREEDGTMWATVEITVDAARRSRSRELAFSIADSLRELAGHSVRGILVDDVAEEMGPTPQRDIDDQSRQEGMVYTLAFRKHNFPEED